MLSCFTSVQVHHVRSLLPGGIDDLRGMLLQGIPHLVLCKPRIDLRGAGVAVVQYLVYQV